MRRALLAMVLLCAAPLARSEVVLRAGNGVEPESLDPQKSEGVSSANILHDLFEGLTSIGPAGGVVPGVAESWERSGDGRTWTFRLREARWNNGDSVSAEDFVAGLRRGADPKTGSAFAQMLSPLVNADEVTAGRLPPERLGAQALDARTLRIELKSPTPFLLGLMTHPLMYPVHRGSLAKHGAQFTRPGILVSNGAYRLDEWVVQSHVRLRRNPEYWNNANTQIDTVYYYPTEDINSELKRYRAGELDYTYEIPLVQAPWVRQNFPGQLRIATYLGNYYFGFNVGRAPFAGNRKLREALAMAIDRDVIVNKVMNGVALPAYGWVPPGTADYTPQRPAWADWPRAQRLAQARRLYAEAGYSAEHPLRTEVRYNTHDDHKRIAVVIAAMWKQNLGAQVRLVNEEFKVFINNRRLKRVTEVFRAAWIGDYDDASSFTDILHGTHGQNDTAWSDPEYERLLAVAAAEPDAQRRREALQAAERRVLVEWPIIPIYYYVSKHMVKPHVQGWQDNILDYHYSKDLRILPH